jgi:GNAT superfamily N-acetyltransferase
MQGGGEDLFSATAGVDSALPRGDAASHASRMDNSLVIRSVQPGDEVALCALVRELAEYERLLDRCKTTPETLAAALFGARPMCEALLAEMAGKAVGMAIFFPYYSSFRAAQGVHLHDLYVTPEMRRHGVGTALLARVAALALERGAPRVEWVVLEWNELALDRYRKLGAEVATDWRIMGIEGEALGMLAGKAG